VDPDRRESSCFHRYLLAGMLLFASGCDSGKQLLGREIEGGDEYLPWYPDSAYYAQWPNSPVDGPNTWIIGVWMQNPANAVRFQGVHTNVFTGLWNGSTEEQLAMLGRAGMGVIGEQAGAWKTHERDATIRGWMGGDQPDNAQKLQDGSFGPCQSPAEVVAGYRAMTANDPTRPVLLQLGRGIVEPDWEGRGADCVGHPEHYADYVDGGDMISVVVYPKMSGLPLATVAQAVEQARYWSADEKPVIPAIQASRVDASGRPTPEQIKAQVWMSIVHRAGGIEYYCHQIEPTVEETDCLNDGATASALEAINRQILELAPVLDTRPIANGVKVSWSGSQATVDTLLKRYQGKTYLFAVEMHGTSIRASFELRDFPAEAAAEVLGEGRSIRVTDGVFQDDFATHGVHLYRID